MRIIAGTHKSRELKTLEGLDTRPMMSRMKESVFNTIGPYFDGGVTLDLFGGSGALTLEGISRGISFGYIVEKSFKACKVIESNIKLLKEEKNVMLLNMDYKLALKKLINDGKKFDIIYLDPPYKLNIVSEILEEISVNDMLNDDGVIICQYVKGNHNPVNTDYLEIRKNYTYASSEVCIYDKVINE